MNQANPDSAKPPTARTVDEALADVRARCRPIEAERVPLEDAAERVPLEDAAGRVLREAVAAPEDLPPFDRSAVDGYAVRRGDEAAVFTVVDEIRAGDWRPRQLAPGEAVRVATGGALPGAGLQVVMQEDVQREGSRICVLRRSAQLNVRFRGEDLRQGQPLLPPSATLHAGALALLASVGHVRPLVTRRVRVLHGASGDEIVPPDQTPQPGQIRDSNSVLLRTLLRPRPCELEQCRLPENFDAALRQLELGRVEQADVLLISGGASVGEHDFTRPLLEKLGYEIIFHQTKARPGKPLLFAVRGGGVAFGLPGNPLAHFVCFHLYVATALAALSGASDGPTFLTGQLGCDLDGGRNPRETLWPARWSVVDGTAQVRPLPWQSSGDITCLAQANALLRVPADSPMLRRTATVRFLPTGGECLRIEDEIAKP